MAHGKGFAPPDGPPNAAMVFVAEALGDREVYTGIPLSGDAGGMYGTMLRRSGIDRATVRTTNIISCQPPGNWLEGAPWQHAAITHCSRYLQPVLAEAQYAHKVIVTLGATALHTILGPLYQAYGKTLAVKDFHGTVHRLPSGQYVIPTFHPSHLQRGAINLLDVVRFDIDRAHAVARDGWAPRPVSLVQDPSPAWFNAWVSRYLTAAAHDPSGVWLAVDCETPDKAGGRDEGELTPEDQSTTILRSNFSCHPDEGITVPHQGPYLEGIAQLLASPGVKLLWNKNYDRRRYLLNGFICHGEWWDLMWAWHRLQSDLPRGLGFAAPFASDFGAWKYLASMPGRESEYAAVDGLQTTRLGHYIVKHLVEQGMWEVFERHTHQLEELVLKPAYELGIQVDIPALDAFHAHLDTVCGEQLNKIKSREAAGTLKPKHGYKKKPKGILVGGVVQGAIPPAGILGKKKGKVATAKDAYIEGAVVLVERPITLDGRICRDCGVQGVGASHNCKKPRKSSACGKALQSPGVGTDAEGVVHVPVSRIESATYTETRWFWHLPFNPDSSQQLLRYITDTGHSPGRAKKTRKPTSNAETLRKLAKSTGDPIYQDILDYRAVKKVDATYALGVKRRIWADGRIHPEYTFKPSMARLSYVNPNITNVVADKDKRQSLAAGFRRTIVAGPGCRLLEVDLNGSEAVDTGWYMRSKDYMRQARLGVHAYLTSHLIGKPASMSWSDADLAMYFKEIKHANKELYDKAKRCLTGDHEVLTPRGWVRLDAYTAGTPVAQWQNESVTFAAPTDVIAVQYDGPMIQLRGRSLSAIMTPTHRLPFRYNSAAPWGETTAGTLPAQGRIPSGGVLAGHDIIADDFLRLIVAVQADGSIGPSGTVFHLVKDRKIVRLRDLLTKLAIPFTDVPCGCHEGRRIRLNADTTNHVAVWLEGAGKIFHLPAFLALTAACRTVVVDELQHWDGHIRKAGGYVYFTSQRQQAEMVQTLAASLGRQALVREHIPHDDSYSNQAKFTVSFNSRANVAVGSLDRQTIPFSGTVYCLTVPSSFFLIKHNDRISVTGNCVHGNNYGLTIYGMVENFPDVYKDLKDAQRVQDLYYAIAPGLPKWHHDLRLTAKRQGYLGGHGAHPFSYKHFFFGVESLRRIDQSEYLRLKARHSPNLQIIDGRPYKRALGEDSKRVIAFFPQSTTAGKLIEAMLNLFSPWSSNYIGDAYFGRTPLRAPIHDSLLMEVPVAQWDRVVEATMRVMQAPLVQLPCPAEWGIGPYLRTGASAKASGMAGNWQDMEEFETPGMEQSGEAAREILYSPTEDTELEDVQDLGTVIRQLEGVQ